MGINQTADGIAQHEVAEWQPKGAARTLLQLSCRDVMGLSPRHGSHVAALIAYKTKTRLCCDWTEVSLYPCAGHRALAATRVSGTALYRSVMDQLLE